MFIHDTSDRNSSRVDSPQSVWRSSISYHLYGSNREGATKIGFLLAVDEPQPGYARCERYQEIVGGRTTISRLHVRLRAFVSRAVALRNAARRGGRHYTEP